MKNFSIAALAFLAGSICFAQTSADGTSNTFVGALPTLGGRAVQVFITVSYSDTAAPEDYVDVAAIRTDTANALQGVTNQSAPLEAFSAAVLNAIYAKYPQLASVGVQISFANGQVTQQTVSSQRTRPPAKPPEAGVVNKR